MGTLFSETPVIFGPQHIGFMIAIVIWNVLLHFSLKNASEKKMLTVLHYTGLFMMLAEVFKQWFVYVYVFDRTVNLWFFPWQLCSVAMYLAFAAKFFKEKLQNACLIYLCTISLLTDIVAILLPYDMLRDQIVLFCHSFIYHGLIISCAILAFHILKKRENIKFRYTAYLFLFTAFIAEIVNVTAHQIFNNKKVEPNMFYISPYYETTQPVFHDIAVNFGILTEIIVYLGVILLFAYLCFILGKKCILKKRNR